VRALIAVPSCAAFPKEFLLIGPVIPKKLLCGIAPTKDCYDAKGQPV
jgi:hypothetical protein